MQRGRRTRKSHRWLVLALVTVTAGLAASAAAAAAWQPGEAHHPGSGGSARPAAVRPAKFSRHSLAPAHGALFGATVQPTSSFTDAGQEAAVTSFDRKIGRTIAIQEFYIGWGAAMPLALMSWDRQHGILPMISLAGVRTSKVSAGDYDAWIRSTASHLAATHAPVMLRWFPEMQLAKNKALAESPHSFVAAWRHMHKIFGKARAGNVRWVWCPSADGFASGAAQRFYPGKSYVDWVCADGYNWAPERHVPWRSFAQIFGTFYRWGLSARKPLLIGEYGVLEGKRGAKGAWFRQAAKQIRSEFPAIRGLVYFNADSPDFGLHFNWTVTSSPSALAGFRAFATDRYFRARPS